METPIFSSLCCCINFRMLPPQNILLGRNTAVSVLIYFGLAILFCLCFYVALYFFLPARHVPGFGPRGDFDEPT